MKKSRYQAEVPTPDDTIKAATALSNLIIKTPMLESPTLNNLIGGRLLLKAECLQITGSFKIRGAYNKLLSLSLKERANGVVAFSSGNHAQGVAHAAKTLNINSTVIMPSDAPQVKLKNAQSYGAKVVTYNRDRENRENIGFQISQEQCAPLVKPFDDPMVIAGQGTVGIEIAQFCSENNISPDAVLVPVGGGGLIAGVGLGLSIFGDDIPLIGVEPSAFNDTQRSMLSGQRENNSPGASSICDALLAASPGELTFILNRTRLQDCISVADDEVRAAIVAAFSFLKLVVEPGGAVALAAILSGHINTKDKTIVAVVSGGNIDSFQFQEILNITPLEGSFSI